MDTIFHNVSPLLYLGILLFAGYAGGSAARALNLPRLSGYIVAGMLFSPSVSGILDRSVLEHGLGLVTEIALGIIAFSIGGALQLDKIKKLGRQILIITTVQAFAVLCAEHARKKLEIAPWEATDADVRRMVEEVKLYDRIMNLQYSSTHSSRAGLSIHRAPSPQWPFSSAPYVPQPLQQLFWGSSTSTGPKDP